MKFSTKLFLSIFVTSVVAVIFSCTLLFGVLSSHRTKEYEKSYLQHVDLIGLALQRLQEAHERLPVGTQIAPAAHMLYDINELDSDVKKIELLDKSNPDNRADGAYWTKENLIIIQTTKAGRIKATIEAGSFNLQIFSLKAMCALLFLGLGIISFGLSKAISETLTRKINSLQDAIGEIEKNRNFIQKIPVDASLKDDELEGLAIKFNGMIESLQHNHLQLIEAEREKAKIEIAAQVAHDIRAPLTSMSLAANDLEKITKAEPLMQLKAAIEKISSVAQKISKSHEAEGNAEPAKLTLIDPMMQNWVSEHNQRYLTGKKIKLHTLHNEAAVWGIIQVNEMQTAVSNLINNSFEAQASEVSLTITAEKSHWVLQIRDNGAGINKDIISRIFDRNFSSGKSSGSGMGLFQVKNAVEWNGGSITVDSVLGLGTTFTIRMPKEKEPAFIARQIEVMPEQKIYFVDNDVTVLEKWRVKSQMVKNQSFFFNKLEDFKNSAATENLVLVLDQRMGNQQEALNMIKEFKLSSSVFLCGNEFDDQKLQDQLQALRIRIIPRALIDSIRLTAKS